MTLRLWIIVLGLVVAGICAVDAATADTTAPAITKKAAAVKKKATKKKKTVKSGKQAAQKAPSGELQTDVKFDDSVLHGQYQTPDEALARVENEKGLGDLLGVRKHFKDRLETVSGQE